VAGCPVSVKLKIPGRTVSRGAEDRCNIPQRSWLDSSRARNPVIPRRGRDSCEARTAGRLRSAHAWDRLGRVVRLLNVIADRPAAPRNAF